MDYILPIALLVIGLVVGAAACWFFVSEKSKHEADNARNEVLVEVSALEAHVANRESQVAQLSASLTEARTELKEREGEFRQLKRREALLETTIRQERRQAAEKLALLNEAQEKLSVAFKAVSADALSSNNETFLKLANATLEKFQQGAKGDLEKRQQAIDSLVKPIEGALKQVDGKLQDLESKRLQAYTGLGEQVRSLAQTQRELRSETANLVKALRRPDVRGRWGEIQLKRVVEMAGMLDHCDFYQQQSVASEEGQLRPDLLVRLPGGKTVVVDSKAPLAAYLDALEESDDAARAAKLKDHARQIRGHVQSLGKKSYFAKFDHTPEFVVLFLPGEVFFSAALETDPSLIEVGAAQNVIIATPTTLIALLRAVSYGWQQVRLAENAKEISDLGRELYRRLAQLGRHFVKLGKGLEVATTAYNQAVGSLEARVLVSARKFEELQISDPGRSLEGPARVDATLRELQAPELTDDSEVDG